MEKNEKSGLLTRVGDGEQGVLQDDNLGSLPRPGTRRDFEAVLRSLGVHDAEIEGTKNWPLVRGWIRARSASSPDVVA